MAGNDSNSHDPLFPKPQWAPIQDLDNVDLVGVREGGGVDLVIAVSQPLDDSADVLNSIRQKVATYLSIIELNEFQVEMGHPSREATRILICCAHPIHPAVQRTIDECRALAHRAGIGLEMQAAPA